MVEFMEMVEDVNKKLDDNIFVFDSSMKVFKV